MATNKRDSKKTLEEAMLTIVNTSMSHKNVDILVSYRQFENTLTSSDLILDRMDDKESSDSENNTFDMTINDIRKDLDSRNPKFSLEQNESPKPLSNLYNCCCIDEFGFPEKEFYEFDCENHLSLEKCNKYLKEWDLFSDERKRKVRKDLRW